MSGRIAQALYADAAVGWAHGAELVYGPLAAALVRRCPDDLRGRVVLDVGAGTGAGSRALLAVGARPVAVDLSHGMLVHDRRARPPAAVGDIRELPVRAHAVDAVLAPFVLNHVDAPVDALRELARAARPGAPILASVFSEHDRPPVKDLVDAVVARHGWSPSAAYRWVKTAAAPLLGSADAMLEAAAAAGLTAVDVVEQRVDVGVSAPAELVAYRLGQAHVAEFLASLGADARAALVAEAEREVAQHHDGADLAPAVVMLVAHTPHNPGNRQR